ncbi:MAG: M23 family metallopeptidase [Brevinematia bacterium]
MRLPRIISLVFMFLVFVISFASMEVVLVPKTTLESVGEVTLVISKVKLTNAFVRLSYNTNIVFPFYPAHMGMVSIIPIPPEIRMKKVLLEVLEDGKTLFSAPIYLDYVGKRKEKIKKLKLTPESRVILTNSKRIVEDIRYIQNKLKGIDLYSYQCKDIPSFSLPSTNRVTSPFGLRRKYSDGRVRYHKGVDFSSVPDENVFSVGDGIVVISSNFLAPGETIYIYHGYGIISSYFHLAERFVKEGEFVSKGQIIGRIGKTGISTGSHLHLGMYVLGIGGYVPIDPISFIQSSANGKFFVEEILSKRGNSVEYD